MNIERIDFPNKLLGKSAAKGNDRVSENGEATVGRLPHCGKVLPELSPRSAQALWPLPLSRLGSRDQCKLGRLCHSDGDYFLQPCVRTWVRNNKDTKWVRSRH